MTAPERPARVRVTAPRLQGAPGTRPTAVPGADPAALYIRSLVRSQRRLAIACALSFLVVLLAVPLVFALVPGLDEAAVGVVPVSWIVIGAGFFPVLIAIAALYVRVAARNEARYRSLADDA